MRKIYLVASLSAVLMVPNLPATADPGDSCTRNADCDNGEHCRDQVCVARKTRPVVEREETNTSSTTTLPSPPPPPKCPGLA